MIALYMNIHHVGSIQVGETKTLTIAGGDEFATRDILICDHDGNVLLEVSAYGKIEGIPLVFSK